MRITDELGGIRTERLKVKIAIIGGGISGLATAYFIEQLRPDAEVLLFEKETYLGGTMHTVDVDGFLFETGANGFLSNKPDTLQLVEDVGAQALLMKSEDAARIRYIYTDKLHRLPETPPAFIASDLLGIGDKLRVLGEIFVPRRTDETDESLQSFGYRRVGRAFTDIFLDAMAAGIHACTPRTLSVRAAFPAVVRLEKNYGGLFKGMIKSRKKSAGPSGTLMSFHRGVNTFIEHLAGRLRTTIYTGAAVTNIERDAGGYIVHATRADKVVLATPAYVAAGLIKNLDPDIAGRLEAIEYSPIAVVGLGYTELDHTLNGFGLLTTTAAGKQILGVLWDSSIFPDRAPAGNKSLRVLIGGQRNPGLVSEPDERLIAIGLQGIEQTMGSQAVPAVTYVKRWQRGIPHYRVGHLAAVEKIFARLERYPGLHLNSNAYFGIGLNDCVANSRRCAQQVVET